MLKRKRSSQKGRTGRFFRGAKRLKRGTYSSAPSFASASRGHSVQVPSLSRWTNPGQLPDTLRVKVRSYLAVQLTSTSGALQTNRVIANTLFHPFRDWSSSTVESAAANNLRNLFQYYRVLGAKLELRLYGTSTTAEQSMWVGVVPEFIGVGQSSSTTISKLTQSPRAKWLIAPAYVAGASAPKYQMSSYLTSATALGNTPMVAQADPSLTGLNNNSGDFGDPAALWQFSLIYQSGDATGTSNIGMDILLTQYVQFEGRAPGS